MKNDRLLFEQNSEHIAQQLHHKINIETAAKLIHDGRQAWYGYRFKVAHNVVCGIRCKIRSREKVTGGMTGSISIKNETKMTSPAGSGKDAG